MTPSDEPKTMQEPGSEIQPSPTLEPPAIGNRRRPALAASWSAINYVSRLSRAKLRQRDKSTDALVAIVVVSLIILSFAPVTVWQLPIALGCAAICVITALWYLANRLGILSTLPERQAILVWDIAIGMFILGFSLSLIFMIFMLLLKVLFQH